MKEHMTLAELAEASGAPARTIRYYIARGLLRGPVKGGRDAAYTVEHLERLDRIRALQSEGRTLAEIAGALNGGQQKPAAAPATAWWQHAVADDVTVWVRADASPWRLKRIRAAVDELARRLRPVDDEQGKEEEIR
ncbi:MAG: MerR family transcriptional regulator [Bryobacteraceae bacterium]|nr:MerR family transcriptional regulator [Bryobacteraceae bacterium]